MVGEENSEIKVDKSHQIRVIKVIDKNYYWE